VNNAQFKQTRPPNESLHNLCRWINIVAIINFGLFAVISIIIGGDAVNGYEEAGRYYLGGGGNRTEVNYIIFTISRLHVYSVFITHPLGIIAGVIYSLTGGKREDFWTLSSAPKEERSDVPNPTPIEPFAEPQIKTSKMILLEFRDNGTRYEDIVLLFNDEEYLADSYYFVLDQESAEKTAVFKKRAAPQRNPSEKAFETYSKANPAENQMKREK